MSLSNGTPDTSRDIAKRLFRAPLYLYQLGWGPMLNWIPLLILTTRGLDSGEPHHVVVEYRRHGSKYYVVSGWGADHGTGIATSSAITASPSSMAHITTMPGRIR